MRYFSNIDRKSTSQVLLRGVKLFAILFGIYLGLSVIYTLSRLPKCASNPVPAILEYNGVWMTMLLLLVIGPITEELSYRLWLSFRKRDVAIGLGMFCITHISILLSGTQTWRPYLILYGLGAILAYGIWRFTSQVFWDKVRQKYGHILIWASIFLFGFIHITNCIEFEWKYLFMYLVLIPLPRIATAYVSTYYRLSIGFKYSVLFHMAINTIIVIPQII